MSTTRELYAPVDLHGEANLWPTSIPALTGPEAMRAARRLWRFANSEKCHLPVVLTSGNRYSWTHKGTLRINPDRGWKHLIHDLSHLFVTRLNPGERPHSKFHARFEAKLVREVIKRGWLDGKLRDPDKAAAEPTKPTLLDRQRAELIRIEASIERWMKKATRARKALAKLERRRRYYTKATA